MKTKLALKHLSDYEVYIEHFRRCRDTQFLMPARELDRSLYDARGGATIVTLIHRDTRRKSVGYSLCSINESFNKKLGKNIALNRAYLLAELNSSCPKSREIINDIHAKQKELMSKLSIKF